jgi:hypothetical protein
MDSVTLSFGDVERAVADYVQRYELLQLRNGDTVRIKVSLDDAGSIRIVARRIPRAPS